MHGVDAFVEKKVEMHSTCSFESHQLPGEPYSCLKKMPSARIELAILSLHTGVILVIRFTTKPRGLGRTKGFQLCWIGL